VGDRWHTGRIEAFSDGVFAIAITLLVLDIHVPPTAFDNLWRGIANEWPAYLGFATSFITIGGFWMAHHGLFRRLEYANQLVMRLNLLLLMAVCFLPFPTRLVAEAIHTANAERAAVIFYGASLLVISLLYAALGQAVTSDRSLLRPEVTTDEVQLLVRQVRPNIGFYMAVIAFAELAPIAAAFGFLVVAVNVVLRARGDNRVVEPA
jgi:TMEM175 potassium channel family protein